MSITPYPLTADRRDILDKLLALAASHRADVDSVKSILAERAKCDRLPTDEPMQRAMVDSMYINLSRAVLAELIPHLADESGKVEQIKFTHGADAAIQFLLDRPPHELPQPDGPLAPDKFRWKGCTEPKIQPIPFKLLQHMWSNPKAERDDVIAAVWRKRRRPTPNAVKTAAKKANAALERTACPARIYPRGDYITLE